MCVSRLLSVLVCTGIAEEFSTPSVSAEDAQALTQTSLTINGFNPGHHILILLFYRGACQTIWQFVRLIREEEVHPLPLYLCWQNTASEAAGRRSRLPSPA